MHRRRCEGMTRLTDASVIRALARKEKLEREIELHGRAIETPQRELEERQIELHDLDTFLELYARFSEDDDLHGDEDITGTANQQPDAPEFVEEDSSSNGSISREQFEADTRQILLEHGHQ